MGVRSRFQEAEGLTPLPKTPDSPESPGPNCSEVCLRAFTQPPTTTPPSVAVLAVGGGKASLLICYSSHADLGLGTSPRECSGQG